MIAKALGKKMVILGLTLAAALGIFRVLLAADAPSTQPTTMPMAKVSPDAKILLDQVRKAYASNHTLSITGVIDGKLDIDGQQKSEHGDFTGTIAPGNKFRNEMKDDVLIGNTGDKLYLYQVPTNQYMLRDDPTDGFNLETIDSDIADIIRKQNYSLALSLAPDAAKEIGYDALIIDKSADVTINGTAYPALAISREGQDVVLAFDPSTHLLVRQTVDLTKEAKAQGASVVKSALYTMDYKTDIAPKIDAQQFAWAPPAGAQEMGHVTTLEGKTAPAFELSDMNGKTVSSQSLAGKVYVLDFWATWCAPCVALLPKMDDLHQETQGKGVLMYAIDLRDEKDAVKKFIDDTKLTIPVLLDTDGAVMDKYSSDGFLPLTVLVGKDGMVRKAYEGPGHEGEVKQQIDEALAAK